MLIHHRDVVEELDDVVWYFDDLFADWGTVSTRLLYRKCREQGIKVVLVGEGAGRALRRLSDLRAPRNGRAARCRGGSSSSIVAMRDAAMADSSGPSRPSCAGISRRARGNMFDAVRLFESRNQLPNNYVMKVDKASMSVSVEARAPYLDRRVAELAYAIPGRDLLAEGTDKLVLRRMAERHRLLPDEIARRPKFGASIAASWMDESDGVPALRRAPSSLPATAGPTRWGCAAR